MGLNSGFKGLKLKQTQTHTHTHSLYVIHTASQLTNSACSRATLHGSTYKKWKNCATTYLSLRSVQPDCLLRPQKAVSRRTFFCFGAAPATAHEDLRTVHCCRRHQFDLHHCCATMNIFIQLTVTCSCNSTQRTHCCVSTATMVTGTRRNVTLYVLYTAFFAFLRCIHEKWLLELSCLCVCLSVHSHGTTRLPLEGFSCNLFI